MQLSPLVSHCVDVTHSHRAAEGPARLMHCACVVATVQGVKVGLREGWREGEAVGDRVGFEEEGEVLGWALGACEGCCVGAKDGLVMGLVLGRCVGAPEGRSEGGGVGAGVAGAWVGKAVGRIVGCTNRQPAVLSQVHRGLRALHAVEGYLSPAAYVYAQNVALAWQPRLTQRQLVFCALQSLTVNHAQPPPVHSEELVMASHDDAIVVGAVGEAVGGAGTHCTPVHAHDWYLRHCCNVAMPQNPAA
jgi:hypothetical protein